MPTLHSVYSCDLSWYSPVYTPFFICTSVTIAALLFLHAWRWSRRLAVGRPGWNAGKSFLLALGALALLEGALSGLTWILPPRAYLDSASMFWTLKPNMDPAVDVQHYDAEAASGWAPDEDIGTLASLKRLEPGLKDVQEGAVATVVSSNSLGLRERELPLQKEDGETRILCIGDSWTFGFGVRVEEAFPRKLEEVLRQRLPGRKITVVNAGMNGAQYSHGYLMLREIGLKYQPDIVLVCGFGLVNSMPVPESLIPASGVQKIMRHSTCYGVLRQLVSPLSGSAAGGTPMLDRSRYALYIARYLSEAGIRSVFFNHADRPLGHDSREIGPAEPHQALVTGVPDCTAISVRPRMLARGVFPFMLREEPHHPSASGHAEMGRVLAEFLVDNHYLQVASQQ